MGTTTSADFAKLEEVSESALLHEALGRRGALSHEFKPTWKGAKVIGRALTVRGVPRDNLMFHLAIAIGKPGDVIVATVDNFLEAGGWGEITTTACQVRQIRGLVLDGSIRDSEQIARMKFPIFCRGISIKGTTKRQKGEINVPIEVGGVLVNPGDYVVGDDDGVVVVPKGELDATVARAHEIRAKEAGIMERLREGQLTLDLLNLRPMLKELGLDRL